MNILILFCTLMFLNFIYCADQSTFANTQRNESLTVKFNKLSSTKNLRQSTELASIKDSNEDLNDIKNGFCANDEKEAKDDINWLRCVGEYLRLRMG